jgi:hypothetical protein
MSCKSLIPYIASRCHHVRLSIRATFSANAVAHLSDVRIGVTASVATRSGWSLVFSVYVFDVPMPGTTKFAVQQRRDPEECRVYRKMALKPWKDIFVFYAYDT